MICESQVFANITSGFQKVCESACAQTTQKVDECGDQTAVSEGCGKKADETKKVSRPKWLKEDDQAAGQATDGQTQNPADQTTADAGDQVKTDGQTADAGTETTDTNANTETPAPTVVNGSEGETTVTEGKKVFKSLFKNRDGGCAECKCEKKGKLSDLVNEPKKKRRGKTFGYAPIVAPLAPEGGEGGGIGGGDGGCCVGESCCGGKKIVKKGKKLLKESYDPIDYDEVYVGRNDEFYNEDPDDESVFQKTLWTWGETSDDRDFAKEGPVFRLTDDGKRDFLEWLDAEQVGGDLCYGRMKDYPKKHLSSEQEWEYLTDPSNGLSEKVELVGKVEEADDGAGDDAKKAALAKHFDVKPEEVTYNGYTYEVDGTEWKVFTEDEAEKAARDYIRESLWAFNADFILDHCATCKDMSDNEREETKKAIGELTGKLCESGNGIVMALIGGEAGIEEFCGDAISADGLANFLSNYDGKEVELEDGFLAYREN